MIFELETIELSQPKSRGKAQHKARVRKAISLERRAGAWR